MTDRLAPSMSPPTAAFVITQQAGDSRRQDITGPGLLDLIWKIRCPQGNWSATLRSDPSVVVKASTGDELDRLARDLTRAILDGHSVQALRTATAAAA